MRIKYNLIVSWFFVICYEMTKCNMIQTWTDPRVLSHKIFELYFSFRKIIQNLFERIKNTIFSSVQIYYVKGSYTDRMVNGHIFFIAEQVYR